MFQSIMYVGFICKETKKRGARNRKGSPLLPRDIRGMCFCSDYSSKVAPRRCPLRFIGASYYSKSFRFRVQRYCFFLTYANFWQKKMHFMVQFRKSTNKKEGQSPPFPRMKNKQFPIKRPKTSGIGCNCKLRHPLRLQPFHLHTAQPSPSHRTCIPQQIHRSLPYVRPVRARRALQ